MKLNDKMKYLDLFLFLYSNPNVNIKKIMEKLGKKYQATNKLLKKLTTEKYVKRRKRTGDLGGAEWEYRLSENVINFLKRLTAVLQETLGFKESNQNVEFVKEFYDALPEIAMESDLDPEDKSFVQFKANIQKYFKKKYGITF